MLLNDRYLNKNAFKKLGFLSRVYNMYHSCTYTKWKECHLALLPSTRHIPPPTASCC